MKIENVVPQYRFRSKGDFIRNQNNFYLHFLDTSESRGTRRKRFCFDRFRGLYPELEKETTREVTDGIVNKKEIPYDLLYKCYKLMSELVFESDPLVMKYNSPERYLIS